MNVKMINNENIAKASNFEKEFIMQHKFSRNINLASENYGSHSTMNDLFMVMSLVCQNFGISLIRRFCKKPTLLSKCVSIPHIRNLTDDEKLTLLSEAWKNNTLISDLSSIKNKAVLKELLSLLSDYPDVAMICLVSCGLNNGELDNTLEKKIVSDFNDLSIKKQVKVLNLFNKSVFPLLLNLFSDYPDLMMICLVSCRLNNWELDNAYKRKIVNDFNNLSIEKQAEVLNKVQTLAAKSGLCKKIYNFITKNLPKPETFAKCNRYNILWLNDLEATKILNFDDILNINFQNNDTKYLISVLSKKLSRENKMKCIAPLIQKSQEKLLGELVSDGTLHMTEDNILTILISIQIDCQNENVKYLVSVLIGKLSDNGKNKFLVSFLKIEKNSEEVLRKLINDNILRISTGMQAIDDAKEFVKIYDQTYKLISTAKTSAFKNKITPVDILKVREIWRKFTIALAKHCFGPNGDIDSTIVRAMHMVLSNKIFLISKFFSSMPNMALMAKQIVAVLDSILKPDSELKATLNQANTLSESQLSISGKEIFNIMSENGTQQLKPGMVILASLFAPFRQFSLPACTIYSLINAEICNRPELLAEMCKQVLMLNRFYLPSGFVVHPAKIVNGQITVNLINGGDGKDEVFKRIKSKQKEDINGQINLWKLEGISYSTTNLADRFKLSIPVYSAIDVIFAGYLEGANYGNREVHDSLNLGVMFMYTGAKNCKEIFLSEEITISEENFEKSIDSLKIQAQEQKERGNHYMRVGTFFQKKVVDPKAKEKKIENAAHAENINIDDILLLDLNEMNIGDSCRIGDSNGAWHNGNAEYLAIKKIADDGIVSRYRFIGGTDSAGLSVETVTEIKKIKFYKI